jgi:uncharacterized lipoprotein YddW (UPF0748 family)
MKFLKHPLLIAFILLLNACTTTTKFPISSVVPAANITAQKGTDKNKNFTLEINVENLAGADRLSPPGNVYSVWIVTKENGTKNVGQLRVENAKKNTFKTVTPFDFNEVFITVENTGDLQYPQGQEIARTKL